jgi:hypothetical protein
LAVPPRTIDARNVLYHFLQRDLHDEDTDLFRVLSARLVSRLSIWLSPTLYARMPLLVPYARRDPNSRGNRAAGIPDQWGSPDELGYFRDDNSLIKGIPRSLPISSSFALYRSRQIGSGFVAAHVWRGINASEIAARNPLTYSFVPNLVWLPAQVAGLSDLEGSFVQRFLQRLSLELYRHTPVAAGHRALVDQVWDLMPSPRGESEVPLPPLHRLSFFDPTEAFFARRAAIIRRVAGALATGSPVGRVVSARYASGIPTVAREAREALAGFLDAYADVIVGASTDAQPGESRV